MARDEVALARSWLDRLRAELEAAEPAGDRPDVVGTMQAARLHLSAAAATLDEPPPEPGLDAGTDELLAWATAIEETARRCDADA